MMETFTFEAGNAPLLVSIPHDGRQLPCEIAGKMTAAGRSIPDTDWHVARLYDFAAELGASLIRAEHSRYVVDLNRSPDDEVLYEDHLETGLCSTRTFSGEDIYEDGVAVDAAERIREFWQPYHDKLAGTLRAMRQQFGYALLWDAHSIKSRVPRLFDGELPELNFGTWDGRSCEPELLARVVAAAEESPYTVVANERFKGGYITRHYGRPGRQVHAIQLELAQRTYMSESSLEFDAAKASRLRDTLRRLLETFLTAAGP